MLMFKALSKQAQNIAIEGFIEKAKSYLGAEFDSSTVHTFLSRSKVHRFDQTGLILGKMVKRNGKNVFLSHGRY